MKFLKLPFLAAFLVAFVIPSIAMAQDHPSEHPSKEKVAKEHPSHSEHPSKDKFAENGVLAIAAADGRFTKFVAAIKAADLSGKLQGEGPFTIFAPTDEAFAKLEKGTLADLMEPANQAQLAGLLANCVVPGKLSAESFKTMKATNFNGRDLELMLVDGHCTVDGANVVGKELNAGNGVIHAIDSVLMPPALVEHPKNSAPKDHPGH